MITRGFITKVPKEGDNIYSVRLPYLEGNSNEEAIYEVPLCTQPGEFNGYNVGDVVIVAFENNRMLDAIILGKLYVEPEKETTSCHVVNNLKVTGAAKLPDSTTIGGYGAKDFFNIYQQLGEQPITPADYIVETVISDDWTYRKWNSGLAECWGTIPLGTAQIYEPTGSFPDMPYAKLPAKAFPFTFLSVPHVLVTANDSGGGIAWAENDHSTTTECNITVTGNLKDAIGSAEAYVTGQWK